MTGTRVLSAALAALVVVLGSTACSDDDPEPKFAPPSASPTPSEPSTSVVSSSSDPVSVARAWIEAQNEALQSGDTSGARGLATENCRSCDGLIRPIEEVFEAGGRFVTKGWTVDKAKEARRTDTRATVNAAVTISGGTTYPSADAEPVEFKTERTILVFKLERAARDDWQIAFIGFLS